MAHVRSVTPRLLLASGLALAGCASHDSATGDDAEPRVTLTTPATAPQEVSQELPDPPVDPAAAGAPCGRCGLSCGVEQECLAAVCTPRSSMAPRLLAPQSFGRVTSQRPTFRWVLPAHVQGARFMLCDDRLCRTVRQSVDLAGQSYRPAVPLSPGVYFWQVLARRGTFLSNKPSPTWEFVVGARDAGVDTVQDRLQDFDGDGYGDFSLHRGAEQLGVYLGGPEGLATAPAVRLPMPQGPGVQARFTAVGDLDGDGFLEPLLLVSHADDRRRDTLFRYRWGRSGLPLVPEEIPLPAGVSAWPDSLANAGDLNDDGYADLVGVDRVRADRPAAVRVFFGGAQGLQGAAAVLLRGDPGVDLGATVSGNGDVNGDGLPDLLLGAPNATGAGHAFVWINRPDACLSPEIVRLSGDPAGGGSLFGSGLGLPGDFNGDGHADPLVAEPYGPAVVDRGRMLVFQGGGGAASTVPATTMMLDGAQRDPLYPRVGLDFNGDGYGDLAVWMNVHEGPTIQLFYGGPSGLSATAAHTLRPAQLGSRGTALALSTPGDANRDGYDDLVVGLEATQWLYLRGSATGVQIIDGPRLVLP